MSLMNVISPISNVSGGGDKGATTQQKQIASSQQNFMNTLQQDFSTSFAGQQNIINALTKNLTNVFQAGPSQFGFSQPELTALNTLATQGNAQAYSNARAAAGEAAAATGVAGAQLPTGAEDARVAQMAQQAAVNQSNALLGIQEAGYKQGAENYRTALQGLTTAASLENPAGLAGQANTAGESAASTARQIQQENMQASPWSQVGGLVGSLAGTALNMVAPGAGTAVSAGMSSLGSLGKGQLDQFGPAPVGDWGASLAQQPGYGFDTSLFTNS